jgi:hypothetical protein
VTARTAGIEPHDLVQQLTGPLRTWLPGRPGWPDVAPDALIPLATQPLNEGWPLVVWVPLRVEAGGTARVRQVVIAVAPERPANLPLASFIGEVSFGDRTLVAFDATADATAARQLLLAVDPSLELPSGVPVVRVFDESSLFVLDDRVELEMFALLHEGNDRRAHLCAELNAGAHELCPTPIVTWRRDHWILGVVRQHQPDFLSADELLNDSLAETLATHGPSEHLDDDVAPSAFAVGRTLALAQLALAVGAGPTPLSGESLVRRLREELAVAPVDAGALAKVAASYDQLAHATDLGSAVPGLGEIGLRHFGRPFTAAGRGRLGLGRAQGRRGAARQDAAELVDSWQLIRIPDGGGQQASPLEDLARLVRSLTALAESGLVAHDGGDSADALGTSAELDPNDSLDPLLRQQTVLAEAWLERAVAALIEGYTSVPEIHTLLPTDRISRDALLSVFELHDSLVRPRTGDLPTESEPADTERDDTEPNDIS